MNPFDIIIDNKKYEFIDAQAVDNKTYVLYADDSNMYISEYEIINNKIILKEVSEEILPKLKEVFNIE